MNLIPWPAPAQTALPVKVTADGLAGQYDAVVLLGPAEVFHDGWQPNLDRPAVELLLAELAGIGDTAAQVDRLGWALRRNDDGQIELIERGGPAKILDEVDGRVTLSRACGFTVVGDLPPLAQLYRTLALLQAYTFGSSGQHVEPAELAAQARLAVRAIDDLTHTVFGLVYDVLPGSEEPVLVYDPVAARQWLIDGAADEHGIDDGFTTTELNLAARLEDLLYALAYGAVPEVWTTRLPLTNVLIWRTADGDGVDAGAIITADLTINGQPVRLAARHQDFDDFTRDAATSGIDAAVEALGHVADLVNREAALLQRGMTPRGVYTVIGVWQDDEPIPVGVVAGVHQVSDGDSTQFEQGLWSTCVAARDTTTAQQLAVEEMRATSH